MGGQVMAIRQRREALERYYQNPNICLCCNKVIEVLDKQKVGEVRKKKFCNQSCNAKYNNHIRIRNPKKRLCECKVKKEKYDFILNKTKKELFDDHSGYQSARSTIRRHAQYVFLQSNIEKTCNICGYDKHIEICHKKSVSSFPNDALVSEINNINNLIGLCPNCHWEMDNMREGQVTQCVS